MYLVVTREDLDSTSVEVVELPHNLLLSGPGLGNQGRATAAWHLQEKLHCRDANGTTTGKLRGSFPVSAKAPSTYISFPYGSCLVARWYLK